MDHNAIAAGRLYDEPPISGLEEETLDLLEQMNRDHAVWNATCDHLKMHFEALLSAYIFPGAVIELGNRSRSIPSCLRSAKVFGGAPRGAKQFRIESLPAVDLAIDGSPDISYWTCEAIPISAKTGKDMNGRPSGAVRNGKTVTLRGAVFTTPPTDIDGPAFIEFARDRFIEFVAECDGILSRRAPLAKVQP